MRPGLFLFFFTACFYVSNAQQHAAQKAEVRHSVTCIISNVMALSLQDNDNGDVNAQRVLVINSNTPCNVVVTENSSDPTFAYPPAINEIDESSHGPAISQLTGGKKISYFRDKEVIKYLTSLLYTAAQY
jgi:hypothetical protein